MRMLPFVVASTMTMTAHAATYTLKPLKVEGDSNVDAVAVNSAGEVTGRFVSSGRPYGAGFVGVPGRIVVLPKVGNSANFPYYYNPSPSAINDAGTVIGNYLADGVFIFVRQDGRYVAPLGHSVDSPPGDPLPYIGTHDHVAYDLYLGDGVYFPTAGTVKSQSTLQTGGFPLIFSTNGSGQVAGQYLAFVGSTEASAVFAGTLDQIAPLLPPGAQASFGGWINDAGQVAGSYQSPRALRGFVYTARAYRTFALPTTPTALVVQGIDGHGRVVGIYTDAVAQYGFVYAHGQATQLGSFPAADTVHVGISRSGRQVVLSDTSPSTQTSQSFTVSCSGAGC